MRVVVTGLGCVTPVGNDVASFWESLINGRHGFAEITRFDTSDIKAKVAAEVKGFDPIAYIPKSEARRTDLYAQYAIAAASQAAAESRIVGNVAPERLGVYFGSGIGGITTMITETDKMLHRGPSRVSPFFVPMMISNIASAMIAILFNAQGQNMPVVSACATGTNAIGEAFRAIKFGYADAIIAGGSEAAINPLSIGGFVNSMALSLSTDPDRCSIPFDKDRDGFVMGEGAGAVVLESFESAVNRGAHIYCELRGYGSTNDAYHVTAPKPDAESATRAIRNAFDESGLTADADLYINAHGTSTPLNDKTETMAIKNIFSDASYSVPISSTKSMTGHMLGAAGAVEAIAAIKTLQTGIIAPTVGYKVPDPDCDLDYVPNNAREQKVSKALSLSFGFGGHNAALLFSTLRDE